MGTRAASRPPTLLDSSSSECPQEEGKLYRMRDTHFYCYPMLTIAEVAAVLDADPAVINEDESSDYQLESNDSSSSTSTVPNSSSDSSETGSDSLPKRKQIDLRKRGKDLYDYYCFINYIYLMFCIGLKRKQELSTAEMLEKVFEKAEERAAERELKMRKMELEFEEKMREKEDQRDVNMLNMFGMLLQKFAENKDL